MKATQQYIEQNKDRFLSQLFELLRIESISSIASHKADMDSAAQWLATRLRQAGADTATIYPTAGPSIVYGQKIIDPALPTILVYGHYDVMPVDPIELWENPPFEPIVKDGRIMARGADDDKGQSYMHIAAFEAMCATGELPCNVKFMFEGQEEIGSTELTSWCAEHKELLKADIILVSDTSMISLETPSITCGLRGLSYVEVEVTGPNRDLHSGLYGGAVANPINVLCDMVGQLIDSQGRITIPGFYDGIHEFSASDRAEIARAPFDEVAFKASIGIQETQGEDGFSTLERNGIRPTLDVCGIWGGYIGEGVKTVIPSKATAKISMRLVAGQDFNKITKIFSEYLQHIAPKSVTLKITPYNGGVPYIAPTNTAAYRAAAEAINTTFGCLPLPFYSGGSIAIISTFEQVLGTKSILMGFGLGCDAIHSPNESYSLECFYKGIATIPYFYKNFAKK
ncbi:MAG: dipeptidase [Mucinivorans sp.]